MSVIYAPAKVESPLAFPPPPPNFVECSTEPEKESQKSQEKSQTKGSWETMRPRTHALLEEALNKMELNEPGPHPFQHRTPVSQRSLGAGCPELTALVDDKMVAIWETTMEAKDQQTLWGLNCLMYAGGRVVTAIGSGDKDKVSGKNPPPAPSPPSPPPIENETEPPPAPNPPPVKIR